MYFFLYQSIITGIFSYRGLDPHSHVVSRRRTTSASSKDHNLAALSEDPAEEDHDSDDSDTATTGKYIYFFHNFQNHLFTRFKSRMFSFIVVTLIKIYI